MSALSFPKRGRAPELPEPRGPTIQRHTLTRALLSALFITIVFRSSAVGEGSKRQPIFLGIIEPKLSDDAVELGTTSFVVRIAFEWNNAVWKRLPDGQAHSEPADLLTHYPKEITWTTAFFDKNDVAFRTYLPARWDHHADVGLELPDRANHVHLLREKGSFHYWAGLLSYRPLVVTSGSPPKVRDPDRWKPLEPPKMPAGTLRILMREFRKAMKPVSFYCGQPASPDYSDNQIVVKNVYSSSRGDTLISMALANPAARNCAQLRRDEWNVQWFYRHGNTTRFLDRSLELLAIGDFDNDGHSEVLFHKRGYDYDGYVLAYDRLQKFAEFGWTYH